MKYAPISFLLILLVSLLSVDALAQVPVQQARLFSEEDLVVLEERVAGNPSDYLARRQYADALYEFGRYREAADNYEVFLQHFQGAPDTIHRYLIAIAGYAGDNLRGENATAKYLTFYPSDHVLYTRLGYFRLWQGKHETAIEAFNQALKLEPQDFEAEKGIVEANAAINLNNRLSRSIPTVPADSSSYPQLDERRYRFIQELMHYRRYSAAYDELMLLRERHDHTRRWLALYTEIDAALVEIVGKTPAYPVDRYYYLLQHQPDNLAIRYNLVEEFISNNRIGEAYETLMALDHVDPLDTMYLSLLKEIDGKKDGWLVNRIEEVEQDLADDPESIFLIKELVDLYQFARRSEETLPLYKRWLALDASASVQYTYARALLDTGDFSSARVQTDALIEQDPLNIDYVRLYTRLALSGRGSVDRAILLLHGFLQENPENVDALLDLSELYLAKGNAPKADTLLRKGFTLGQPRDKYRLYLLDQKISVQLLSLEKQRQEYVLNQSQKAALEESYAQAIDLYLSYLDIKGIRTRGDLTELARLYSLSGDYVTALSILYELMEKGAPPTLLKEIAKNRYYMADHSGAILELKTYLTAFPNDVEARSLLQQIYIEVQDFKEADSILIPIDQIADNSRIARSYKAKVKERITLIERSISTDYVGLVVPVSRYTRAQGSITSYEHWAQGLLTQITMPADPRPFVLTAGLISHFLEGSRRLLPNTAFALSRVNQVLVGSYFDLTEPPVRSSVGYRDRLLLEFGVFDYSGGRTTGFAEIYYLRHRPGRYTASFGWRSTEGGISLWSPAGGEFGLRLSQLETTIESEHILPNSALRLRAEVDFNFVKGVSDSTLTDRDRNNGTSLRLESSYRVLRNTFLGLSFNAISYEHTLETYFSPGKYRAYDIWVEYEDELIGDWYFRSRLTSGIAFYRRSSFAARLEADVIYRFNQQLSFSLNASAGYSVRFLDGEEALRDNRFRMALFSAALYWTL